jgi:signal recognition particle subunit SRP54
MRAVTGVPIKFLGVGEKPEALEPFHADRLASRILGMGDVLTLIEKAQQAFDAQQAAALEEKLRSAHFDLEDFLEQIQQVRKMGPLRQVVEMVPGLGNQVKGLDDAMSEKQLKRIEAIIRSMTPEERRNPKILDGSRKRRIARGSGTTPQEINQLLKQFEQMQRLMKMAAKGGHGRTANLLDLFQGR